MTRSLALIAVGILAATTGCARLATMTDTRVETPNTVHDVQTRYTVQMAGKVTRVNARAGQVTLENADGAMTLTFPSEALQTVRVGDHVVVAAGLLNVGSHPSASPRMKDDGDDESDSSDEAPGKIIR
jgi:hypothetical protein